MPTTNEPKLQPPMEAASADPASRPAGENAIVATQPKAEPQPMMENDMEMTLRGGGCTHYCGFSCCDGRCNFRLC
ncbi:uncharacterized protein C8A04DRAFT_29638 [Dichotomopilus funicola]|uniref:Uncharacterized protein n=1 Tax=Dichotomopilus funicola TaxID=1934379 RepID=A0AAN6V1E8_9PEZI|nr:hypothetical protein C8A04DRAFT_29638 [Dichotomopilus funicola]